MEGRIKGLSAQPAIVMPPLGSLKVATAMLSGMGGKRKTSSQKVRERFSRFPRQLEIGADHGRGPLAQLAANVDGGPRAGGLFVVVEGMKTLDPSWVLGPSAPNGSAGMTSSSHWPSDDRQTWDCQSRLPSKRPGLVVDPGGS